VPTVSPVPSPMTCAGCEPSGDPATSAV
jgi:hypothetical protein